MLWRLPEKFKVGDGLGVVAHGVAKLNHGLAEVRQAVRVDLQLAGLQKTEQNFSMLSATCGDGT